MYQRSREPSAVLLWIPVQQPHFNSSSFQSFLKYCEIGSAIVVGDDNLRMKGLNRVSSLFRRHGVRQIHAHERHVDVLKRTHLRHTFGITGKIEALAAVSKHLAIAPS